MAEDGEDEKGFEEEAGADAAEKTAEDEEMPNKDADADGDKSWGDWDSSWKEEEMDVDGAPAADPNAAPLTPPSEAPKKGKQEEEAEDKGGEEPAAEAEKDGEDGAADGAKEEDAAADDGREKAEEAAGGEAEGAAAEEKAEEAAAPEDPNAMEIGWEAAAWLKEEDSKRLKHLQDLAGVEMEVDENGKLTMLELDEEEEDDALWAKQCVLLICAMRSGEDVKSLIDEHPSMTKIEVPDDAKTKLKGKNPEKFITICETIGVIAAFAEASAPESSKEAEADSTEDQTLSAGDKVEAEYEAGNWNDAVVVEVTDDTVKLKWTYDESEGSVSKDKVKKKKGDKGTESDELVLEAGTEVEAKYEGEKWEGAVVQELDGDTVKIKWMYDDSEASVSKAEVRKFPKQDDAQDSAPAGPATIMIIGEVRPRLEMELRVLHAVEQAAPGSEAQNPRLSEDSEIVVPADGLGLSKVPLLNDGAWKGRVVGKGGSMKKTITKVCGSELEFLDKNTYIVGNTAERKRTAALLDVVQKSGDGQIEATHPDLEDITTVMQVPRAFAPQLVGKNRQPLMDIEAAVDVLIFFIVELRKETAPQDMQVGSMVQAKKEDGTWVDAKILEVLTDEDDEDYRAFRIQWSENNEEAEVPAFCARMPKNAETLAQRPMLIIGRESDRKIAELKCRRVIEEHCSGTFPAEATTSEEDFGLQVMTVDDERGEVARSDDGAAALQRAALASGCLGIEPVGKSLHLLGTVQACERARRFLIPALSSGTPEGALVDGWQDTLKRFLPLDKKDRLVEASMREIEKETQTLIFLDDAASAAGLEDQVRLVVCGATQEAREAADVKLQELEEKEPPPKEEWSDNKDDSSWGDQWNADGEDKWKQDDKWGDDGDKWKKDSGGDKWGQDDWKDDKKGGGWNDKKDDWGSNNKRGRDDDWGDNNWSKQAKTGGKDDWNSGGKDDGWGSSGKDDWKSGGQDDGWGSSGKDDWKKKDDGWGSSGKDDWNSGSKHDSWGSSGKDDWKKDNWNSSNKDDGWGSSGKDDWRNGGGKDDWKSQKDSGWGGGGKKDEWGSSDGGGWGNSGGGSQNKWEKDDWNGGGNDKWGGQDNKRSWGDSNGSNDQWDARKQQRTDQSSWDDSQQEESRVVQPPPARSGPWRVVTQPPRNMQHSMPMPSAAQNFLSMPPQRRSMMPSARGPGMGLGMANRQQIGSRGVYIDGFGQQPQFNQVPQISRNRTATAASRAMPQSQQSLFGAPPQQQQQQPQFGVHRQPQSQPTLQTDPLPSGTRSDPEEVLKQIDMPDTIADWEFIQDVVWEGWHSIPQGWIRVWSPTERREYFLRLADEYTTYDENEMYAS